MKLELSCEKLARRRAPCVSPLATCFWAFAPAPPFVFNVFSVPSNSWWLLNLSASIIATRKTSRSPDPSPHLLSGLIQGASTGQCAWCCKNASFCVITIHWFCLFLLISYGFLASYNCILWWGLSTKQTPQRFSINVCWTNKWMTSLPCTGDQGQQTIKSCDDIRPCG